MPQESQMGSSYWLGKEFQTRHSKKEAAGEGRKNSKVVPPFSRVPRKLLSVIPKKGWFSLHCRPASQREDGLPLCVDPAYEPCEKSCGKDLRNPQILTGPGVRGHAACHSGGKQVHLAWGRAGPGGQRPPRSCSSTWRRASGSGLVHPQSL